VRREGWLETLLGYLEPRTMLVGSQDRVILPLNPFTRLDARRKRRKLERRWRQKGLAPKCITHCILYRRELFTEHAQRFDYPEWIDGVYNDTGEFIQRYCEDRQLGIHFLTCEDLAPLLCHFEAATLNLVTGRRVPWKRRLRRWSFYRRAGVREILADESLDR
jgi:hypothetical protein